MIWLSDSADGVGSAGEVEDCALDGVLTPPVSFTVSTEGRATGGFAAIRASRLRTAGKIEAG
jgi:hypothetical protein